MAKHLSLPATGRPILVCLACALLGVPIASATDAWEPDGDPATVPVYTQPGHPPQSRDLQAIGGVADIDWIAIWMRPLRSYEVFLSNQRSILDISSLQRMNSTRTITLQSSDGIWSGPGFNTSGGNWYLRWEMPANAIGNTLVNWIRIEGQAYSGANTIYSLVFRDTTLFCPRFNNTNSQVSVLMLQGVLEGTDSCDFHAHFSNEAGTLLGSQAGTINADRMVIVINTPNVAGVANHKGGAQITHTCGYGNLKAKVVALEPATGFSFDTPCTVREQ